MKRNKRSEKARYWQTWKARRDAFFARPIEQIRADYDSVPHGAAPKTTLDAGA